MSNPVTLRPAICLNMTVRNVVDTVHELLDSAAPYISSWIIVDTGSDDGTPERIRRQLARLGIPGELHERPWRSAADNQTEALTLAQGHGDYIWVLDADDTIVGTPDFSRLSADVYWLRGTSVAECSWHARLFRDGLPVHFEGAVHKCAIWKEGCVAMHLGGDYRIESRDLGRRRFERDRDLLLAELDSNPEDPRTVFSLAQSYFDLGDFVNARAWYSRRLEMGGAEEELYLALYRIAQSMQELGEPWPEVQAGYLKAWEFRPTRAEPLWAIGYRHRIEQRYQLGYRFAKRAAEIPLPDEDKLFVREDIYAWRAADEQAVCASWTNKHAEAFMLWRRLLTQPDIPESDRRRIAGNRDICVPTMANIAAPYPYATVHRLQVRDACPEGADVVVSVVAGPDLASTEQTLNSFLRCCLDVSRVARFLVFDAGLPAQDRALLLERYRFLEIVDMVRPGLGAGSDLADLRAHIDGRFWLQLSQGWRFFAPEKFIARLTGVLQAEPQVVQVGINFTDAPTLIGASAVEPAVRQAPAAGRYVLTDAVARGPAMFDIARLDRAGGVTGTASLDEVLCVAEVQPGQHAVDRRTERLPRITGIVLDEWKIIYVITPKAMCTSMLWFLIGLQNQDLAHDVRRSRSPEVTRGLSVHDPAMWQRARLLHSLPPDEIEQLSHDDGWLRFGFTRHPVDRLWSAWQSKLLLREPTPTAVYAAAPWFPRAPRELPRGAGALDAIAEDFGHFVAALAEDPQLVSTDPHWTPQSYLLRPGFFPYSEIGRVEASATTIDRLERHLRAQGWQGTLELERLNATLVPRTIVRDPAVLRLIEKVYADDMVAFGYESTDVGQPPPAEAGAVAVKALIELVDRHERIRDLHHMLAPEYYAGSPEWFSTFERSAT